MIRYCCAFRAVQRIGTAEIVSERKDEVDENVERPHHREEFRPSDRDKPMVHAHGFYHGHAVAVNIEGPVPVHHTAVLLLRKARTEAKIVLVVADLYGGSHFLHRNILLFFGNDHNTVTGCSGSIIIDLHNNDIQCEKNKIKGDDQNRRQRMP